MKRKTELEAQIERITKYEDDMREAERLLAEECRSSEDDERLRTLTAGLEAYYGSDEWKADYAADEAGLLPKELKRGVLSEDGLYDLLEDYEAESENRILDHPCPDEDEQ